MQYEHCVGYVKLGVPSYLKVNVNFFTIETTQNPI